MHCIVHFIAVAVAVVLPLAGGAINAYFFPPDTKWYQNLNKPSWNPPNWIFPVVWTVLYFSMGFASYIVWKDGGGFEGRARLPLILYIIQLILNWAWTPAFFGLHSIVAGLAIIILLDLTATATTIAFLRVNLHTFWLMAPYLVWLAIATTLNFTILQLN